MGSSYLPLGIHVSSRVASCYEHTYSLLLLLFPVNEPELLALQCLALSLCLIKTGEVDYMSHGKMIFLFGK